ncbi:MAG: DUF721 domain-containing protein [Schwartzia sp.]|nr:DUF721 domain-containing protein [Schwartzia sp. (in: firmicutes)]
MRRGKAAAESARSKKTERAMDVLPRFVASLKQEKKYNTQLMIHHWEKIVGSSIASHVRPVRMDFHKLFLAADAPVWANELRYMKREIIDKINAFVCDELVTEILFCAPREKLSAAVRQKNEKDPVIVPEKEEREKSSALVSSIEDEGLRSAASRALSQNFALRRAISKEGGHSCPSCGRMVTAKESYCFLCERKQREQDGKKVRRLLLQEPWLHGYEASRILGCSPETVARERNALLRRFVSRVRQGDETSPEAKRLVMLFASVKPEELTEPLIAKTLQRLRYDLAFSTEFAKKKQKKSGE